MKIYYSETEKPGFKWPADLVEYRWVASAWIPGSGGEWEIEIKHRKLQSSWLFAIAEDFDETEDFYRIAWQLGNTPLSAEYGYHATGWTGEGDLKYAVAASKLSALLMLAEGMIADSSGNIRTQLESQFENVPW